MIKILKKCFGRGSNCSIVALGDSLLIEEERDRSGVVIYIWDLVCGGPVVWEDVSSGGVRFLLNEEGSFLLRFCFDCVGDC